MFRDMVSLTIPNDTIIYRSVAVEDTMGGIEM